LHTADLPDRATIRSRSKNLIDEDVYDGWTKEDLPGEAFHAVTNSEELNASFETIMADNPDIIKAYLMFAETKGPRGLTPELLAELVGLADAEGKRVTVHAQSANDVRLAAEAGADQIAHMPPMPFRHKGGDRSRISAETAQLLAERNVSVVTTAVLANRLDDGEQKDLVRSLQIENLKTLRDAGVTLAVGSDSWSSGQNEALYLHDLGVFDNQALLKLWTDTGQVIFPDRMIGRLAPDHEASLLALSCNPLDDFTCVDKIDVRIKQGTVIDLPTKTASSQ
jgi:imidazolonepropionase-like amidohydrolase